MHIKHTVSFAFAQYTLHYTLHHTTLYSQEKRKQIVYCLLFRLIGLIGTWSFLFVVSSMLLPEHYSKSTYLHETLVLVPSNWECVCNTRQFAHQTNQGFVEFSSFPASCLTNLGIRGTKRYGELFSYLIHNCLVLALPVV